MVVSRCVRVAVIIAYPVFRTFHNFPSGCAPNHRRPVVSISVLDDSHWSSGGRADWASTFGAFLERDQN